MASFRHQMSWHRCCYYADMLEYFSISNPDKQLSIKIGDKFGQLIIVDIVRHNFKTKGLCLCSCGTKKPIMPGDLRTGRVVSCGCKKRKDAANRQYKHGHATKYGPLSPTYKKWIAMKDRCYNPSSTSYEYYGGRGIKVCERWKDSFENFLADMGHVPEGLTLERKNSDKDYSPDNCCWATREEQIQNRTYRKYGHTNSHD